MQVKIQEYLNDNTKRKFNDDRFVKKNEVA